ncbi:pirin family protein [Emcibacter sp.]|uniref:pirin family protein n=1 Tax=Emcibacter sp. TaxID=1979954 RepID=UPI003A944F60
MITKRCHKDRGVTVGGWLESKHSFSFGRYHDPRNMGYGPLRVINEDRIRPGAGFGTHDHENMEIITWVLSGRVAHRDSTGSESELAPGEIQLMSAGRGIQHSEYNRSEDEELHLLQIWIMPNEVNTQPGYQQQKLAVGDLENEFRLLVSPDGAEGSLVIQQQARLFGGRFRAGSELTRTLNHGQRYWLQVARGRITVGEIEGESGDGFALEGEDQLRIANETDSEVLLFELPR